MALGQTVHVWSNDSDVYLRLAFAKAFNVCVVRSSSSKIDFAIQRVSHVLIHLSNEYVDEEKEIMDKCLMGRLLLFAYFIFGKHDGKRGIINEPKTVMSAVGLKLRAAQPTIDSNNLV